MTLPVSVLLLKPHSSLQVERLVICSRNRGQCSYNEHDNLQGWKGRSSSLSSLSFCGDEDYCSRRSSVGRTSVPFLFFLYYPSSNFWLAFFFPLSVCRSQEGDISVRRRPNLIPCSDHHRPPSSTISYLWRLPLSPLTHKPLIVHLGQKAEDGRRERV